jgi:hypothetical protein
VHNFKLPKFVKDEEERTQQMTNRWSIENDMRT